MHLILVTYDIQTTTLSGKKRQRKIAKLCERIGTRVQHSVFECYIDARQYTQFKHDLLNLLHPTEDQIKLYRLGKNFSSKIETLGKPAPLPFDEPFIF